MHPTVGLWASVLMAVGCSSLLPVRPRDGAAPDAAPDPPAVDAAEEDARSGPIVGLGPALYWKFDEAAGTEALDSSGNGFTGIYTGDTGAPTPAMDVPGKIGFPDPLSRAFGLAARHAVRLSPLPDGLRPQIELTVALWYRATAVDTNPPGDAGLPTGSELISGGNHYLLRVRSTQIEFSKRVMGPTGGAFVQCFANADDKLDGNWHHIAGLSSAQGIKLYFDGTERCSSTDPNAVRPFLYDQGMDFWVGRHGNGQSQWDFGGFIDDVRVYTRALTPEEIAGLAAGGPGP